VRHPSGRAIGIIVVGLGALLVPILSAQQPASDPRNGQPPASASANQQPAAQQPAEQQPPRQPTPFRTEANYVRVDVYPTKAGQPVLDLRAEEFEVLENGARQQVQAFEHVVISPAGQQSLRSEANSVRAGEQMAANPRNRVFVFFLDAAHVAVDGSHRIKEPLIRLIDRILGPDDLIAVMTPEMMASQITFGRKTEVIADMLRDKWTWGQRDSIIPLDNREIEYSHCYPAKQQEGLVQQMVDRRRERMTLDALRDLVIYLGTVREERKAILPITTGWLLYRPDPSMNNLRVTSPNGETEPIPGKPPVGVDEFGKIRINPPRRGMEDVGTNQTRCDNDRMYLSSIDDEDYFRRILDTANRNNASFYPIDPRGLGVFDSPIGPKAPPPITVDMARLRERIENLRTLAENTDGIAVVNTNDLDKGLQRVADDLTSYYLLGYYSTNTKLDGSYRRITVRVKRPGVDVRARRGYRAATAEEVEASRTAVSVPVPDSVKTTAAAMATLSRIREEQRFSVYAIPVRSVSDQVNALWIAGEMLGPLQESASGGNVAIDIAGGATANASAAMKPGERAFLIKVPVPSGSAAFDVRARLTKGTAGEPFTETAHIDAASQLPLLFRRGMTTGNRIQPAADFRFSRTERLRLELPIIADAVVGAARLLDRTGQPLPIPFQVADKKDAEGQRWLTADAMLSALGAGDYAVEISYTAGGTEQKIVTAIRVTR
jgi:VWFA-related protein